MIRNGYRVYTPSPLQETRLGKRMDIGLYTPGPLQETRLREKVIDIRTPESQPRKKLKYLDYPTHHQSLPQQLPIAIKKLL